MSDVPPMVFRNSFSEGLAVFELEPRGKGSMELHALAEAVYSHPRPDSAGSAGTESARSAVDSIFGPEFDAPRVVHPVLSGAQHHGHRVAALHEGGEESTKGSKRKKKKDKSAQRKKGKKRRKEQDPGKGRQGRKSKKTKQKKTKQKKRMTLQPVQILH